MLPCCGVPKVMSPAVAVVLVLTWPPTPRAHTPPPSWSGWGLAGLEMNALDCVRNAVFTELIEVVRAPTDADTLATAMTAALATTWPTAGGTPVMFTPFGVH